jgi:hypothetical protein
MNCNQVRELLPDLAAGMSEATPEIKTHLCSCATCSGKLQGLRQTMALLDEWQTPSPSPYFDTRLAARLREDAEPPAAGLWHWVRRPVWAISLAMVMVVGAVLIGNKAVGPSTDAQMKVDPPVPGLPALPGTAVGDLQALDKNNELYADFDVLDELQVQSDVSANP